MSDNYLQKAQNKTKEQHQSKVKTRNSDAMDCPNCGRPVKKSWEYCPHCGQALVDYCTFCGADVPPGEPECPECGMSRKGVICPNCGAPNGSGFCRNCNQPLTLAAKKELERAKKDPLFIKAAELLVRAAELQQMIEAGESGEEPVVNEEELPDDIKQLKALLAGIKLSEAQEEKKPAKTTPPAKSGAPAFDPAEELKKIQAELAATFNQMVPPPGSTPQEQRNYHSARKMPVEKITKTVTKIKEYWICNYCGFQHRQPSECCEPWRGGTWTYTYHETIQKEIVFE